MREFQPYTPSYRAAVYDITGFVHPEFVARCGGAVYEVFIFDERSATYLCEATPSAELHHIGYVPKTSPDEQKERDALEAEFATWSTETVLYRHMSDAVADSVPLNDFYYKFEEVMCETPEEARDDLYATLEACWGNPAAEWVVDRKLRKERLASLRERAKAVYDRVMALGADPELDDASIRLADTALHTVCGALGLSE